jgi:hypothetical protein
LQDSPCGVLGGVFLGLYGKLGVHGSVLLCVKRANCPLATAANG